MDAQGEYFRRAMLSPEERTEEAILRVEEMVKTLTRRVQVIEKQLAAIQGSTERMDTHIHFTARVYEYFKDSFVNMANLVNSVAPSVAAPGGAPWATPGFAIEDNAPVYL